jgi:hypothetical protein
VLAYGDTSLESSSGLTAARCCHRSAADFPTSGIFSIQPGDGGILSVDSDLNHPTISSDRLRMVITARQTGTIKNNSNTTVATSTASHRLFQSRDCNFRKYGQVAMTIIAAQSSGDKNGRITQKQAAISTQINNTASVVRVRSDELVRVMMEVTNAARDVSD